MGKCGPKSKGGGSSGDYWGSQYSIGGWVWQSHMRLCTHVPKTCAYTCVQTSVCTYQHMCLQKVGWNIPLLTIEPGIPNHHSIFLPSFPPTLLSSSFYPHPPCIFSLILTLLLFILLRLFLLVYFSFLPLSLSLIFLIPFSFIIYLSIHLSLSTANFLFLFCLFLLIYLFPFVTRFCLFLLFWLSSLYQIYYFSN